MNPESIEEIRSASFTLVRRGYDPDEVRRFLTDLTDRLEREPGHPGSEAVRRELGLVGEKTAAILAQAEESAERMHSEAVREASAVLAKAREESEATRRAADEETSQMRTEAESYAEATRAEADREGVAQVSAELEELERRREDLLADLSAIADELERTIASRAPGNGAMTADETPEPGDPAPAI